MGKQGEALAEKLQEATKKFIAVVEGIPDDLWKAKTKAEGWTVGVAAHHVAGGLGATSGLVQAVASGQPLPPLTTDMLDGQNAEHAGKFANCTKAETIAMAKQNSAAAVTMLKGLSDEQLARTGTLPTLGSTPLTGAQLTETLVIGHLQGHHESIAATAAK